MINQKSLSLERSRGSAQTKLGTLAHFAIFAWMLVMVMLAPAHRLLLAGSLCFLVVGFVYPRSFLRLMNLRWLVMIVLLSVPPVFFLGDLDRSIWGIAYSTQGLLNSLQIMLRIMIVLVSVDGFTSSVDISSIAGLLERFGLRGLGFSMGVALNLLPCLRTAAMTTWHSLSMRGGLRKQRWRGIRLLMLTIITNALRRTEEIALAAEGRAFSPEKSRALPLRAGSLDWMVITAAGVTMLVFFLLA